MKKISVLLFAYLIIHLITSGYIYPYADISVKANYFNGTVNISKRQKATLSVKDDSIVFTCGKNIIEIPYSSIIQMSWSEKKKRLKFDYPRESGNISARSIYKPFNSYLPPVYIPPSMPKIEHEFSAISYVLMAISLVLVIVGIVKMMGPKKVYFRIDFEIDGQHEWMLFKIVEDRFNVLYLDLINKSGKEIILFEK